MQLVYSYTPSLSAQQQVFAELAIAVVSNEETDDKTVELGRCIHVSRNGEVTASQIEEYFQDFTKAYLDTNDQLIEMGVVTSRLKDGKWRYFFTDDFKEQIANAIAKTK